MIMIKVLHTSIQGQTAKRVEKKNIIIKKSHGLVREGKVEFHLCASSKEKIINIPIIRIPVMATWDDHDSSVNDGG